MEVGRKANGSGWGQGHRIMRHERELGMGRARLGVGCQNSDDRMSLRGHYI